MILGRMFYLKLKFTYTNHRIKLRMYLKYLSSSRKEALFVIHVPVYNQIISLLIFYFCGKVTCRIVQSKWNTIGVCCIFQIQN